jgi:hypothetical protein
MSPIPVASWCAAMKLVPEPWRMDFCRFIEEGEASDEFIAFLEQDQQCRNACEMVLRADQEMVQVIADAVCEPESVAQ